MRPCAAIRLMTRDKRGYHQYQRKCHRSDPKDHQDPKDHEGHKDPKDHLVPVAATNHISKSRLTNNNNKNRCHHTLLHSL